jgi:hypothetical protein
MRVREKMSIFKKNGLNIFLRGRDNGKWNFTARTRTNRVLIHTKVAGGAMLVVYVRMYFVFGPPTSF